MPRRISQAEADALLKSGAATTTPPRRRISAAEAEQLLKSRAATETAPGRADQPSALDASTKAGTALRGFGKGASLGFSDELGGAAAALAGAGGSLGLKALQTGPGRVLVRALAPQLANAPDAAIDALTSRAAGEAGEAVLGAPVTANARDTARGNYLAQRNFLRADDASSAAANPWTHRIAEVAGGAWVPTPAAGARVGGLVLTKAGARALGGAGMGAALGAGNSEAELVGEPRAQGGDGLRGLAGDVASSSAAGAALAPAIGGAFDAGGRVLSSTLRKLSEINALRAAGLRAGISDALKGLGIKTETEARDLGKNILDLDVVKFGETPADVARRAQELQPGYSAMVGRAIEAADEAVAAGGARPFDFGRAAYDATNEVLGTATSTEVRKGAEAAELIKDILRQGELTPGAGSYGAAQNLKQAMQRGINYRADPTLQVEQQQQVARAVRNNLVNQIREEVGDHVADDLATGNLRLGTLHDIEALASNAQTRDVARQGLLSAGTLWQLLSAGGGAGLGGMAGGTGGAGTGAAAALFAAKALQPRIPGMLATTQRALSPAVLGAAGPAGSAATIGTVQAISERDQERARALVEALRSGSGRAVR